MQQGDESKKHSLEGEKLQATYTMVPYYKPQNIEIGTFIIETI